MITVEQLVENIGLGKVCIRVTNENKNLLQSFMESNKSHWKHYMSTWNVMKSIGTDMCFPKRDDFTWQLGIRKDYPDYKEITTEQFIQALNKSQELVYEIY